MSGLNVQIDPINDAISWRSLRVYAAYRLFLAAILLTVFYFKLPPDFLGESNASLYSFVSQLYFLIAVGLLFMTVKQWVPFPTQTKLQLLIDIVVITLLIHASGGLKTSLGSLLVVVVVAGSVLMPGRLSIFIAAIATLAILSEAIYSEMMSVGMTEYNDAGILGATFFAIAILTQILSRKITASQQLAEERAADIVNLAMLNDHIINRMQTGVIVVNSEGQIQLSNLAARQWLAIDGTNKTQSLKHWVPNLGEQLLQWQQNISRPFIPFQARPDLPELAINAILLESGEAVLYIENRAAISQQAQQLKLASLGQLTASIAHEVRNPLGAISHAGELLAEANNDKPETRKLTDIILRHSARVNNIIETILQMSQRKKVEPAVVMLATWLTQLINEYINYKQESESDITLTIKAPIANVYLDTEQLRQVLWNLLDNAWHYSQPSDNNQRVQVILALELEEVVIDVIDNGPGVSEMILPALFEPFQSERKGGTGLGLYLARELCQANSVRLNYAFDRVGKSCFSLHIPLRKQENLK
ncbi:MAG: two-component system sensor histidine kinase PilS (NtrC family) [Methylophagaceae bacterium]|jgi:two-component system sensor histidine kinase PilS (NtrC family)